ncbi:TetR/AcrR family transcriptional regulator [Chitinophaga sp. Mgbs1]|uniref:TetR/AcrR family transcriptional regulator n=1 Tax=Chitinophaga solisilvae TaxID=1233460 RepID=A0A3S1BPF2_9BACT|nr:TetR/AcrR family transcriptional regulator [Chitinophaga solisilvae]
MRPQKTNDTRLIEGLITVLQSRGFEGASLNDLAQAAGLQKASLYHRFPGGKQEIAITALRHVQAWIKDHIYLVLTRQDMAPEAKLDLVLQHIQERYQQGEKNCILNALSFDSGLTGIKNEISTSMQLWIDAFTALGTGQGLTTSQAGAKARQSLILVEGSLVLARGSGNTAYFHQALAELKKLYINT